MTTSSLNPEKEKALEEIRTIMAYADIHLEDIEYYLEGRSSSAFTIEKDKNIVGKLLGYFGGLLIFSGLGLLINLIWNDIGSLQRVILTFGSGLTAFILAFIFRRDERFEKSVTPLFLIAAFLEPFGLFVFLQEYMPPTSEYHMATMGIFAITSLQFGLSFYALNRTNLLFFTLIFWNCFITTAMDWLKIDEEWIGIVVGISMISLAYGIGKTVHRPIAAFWHFFGGIFLLTSWWFAFEKTPLDITFLGVNAFLVYISIIAGSRTLLFVNVIGFFAYMSYFAAEYFADVIGWPVCLIVLGLIMIASSAYALKLGKKLER